MREAIERSLTADAPNGDALDRLASLGAPIGDVDRILAEIDAWRG